MILATPMLRRAFWSFFIPALALAYAALAVAVPWPSQGEVLSYAAASLPAHAADVITGLALIGCGIVVYLNSTRRTLGAASILAGVTWFALDWEGWGRGPEFVRSLGTAAAPLTLALLLQLVVTLPRGRASQPGVRTPVVLVYAVAITFSVGQALFRAPALDPHCWRDCLGNTFLAHGDRGTAQALAAVWLRASVAIGIAIAVIAARRFSQLGIGRRALGPALAAGVVVGASEAAYSAALIAHPAEDPADDSLLVDLPHPLHCGDRVRVCARVDCHTRVPWPCPDRAARRRSWQGVAARWASGSTGYRNR